MFPSPCRIWTNRTSFASSEGKKCRCLFFTGNQGTDERLQALCTTAHLNYSQLYSKARAGAATSGIIIDLNDNYYLKIPAIIRIVKTTSVQILI